MKRKNKSKQSKEIRICESDRDEPIPKKKCHQFVPWVINLENLEHSAKKAMFFFFFFSFGVYDLLYRNLQWAQTESIVIMFG